MSAPRISFGGNFSIGTGRKATIWQAWDEMDAAETDSFHLTRREAVAALEGAESGVIRKIRIGLNSSDIARALRVVPMR